jgi:outer membrane murein-binding lipoprotein Lpp
MIRINLHDYRDELRKIEIQKRVVKSLAIIIVAIFFILASWLNEQAKLDLVKSETRKLQSQVAALTSEVNLVKEMGGKVGRLESIVLTIEGLREKQLPASTIIGDLNLMVPEGLWLHGIVQRDLDYLKKKIKKFPTIMFGEPVKKKRKRKRKKQVVYQDFVEVTGYALTESGVAEYLERLQKIPYYKATFLYKLSRTYIGGQAVHKFAIYCYMPEKKKKKAA